MNYETVEKEIQRETAALESLFEQAHKDYYTSPEKLGKSWYAIGLESNDSDVETDSIAKKGIVSRMLTALMNFIKSIVNKIKSFFTTEREQAGKESEQTFKTYDGPSDDAMAKGFRDFCSSMDSDAEAYSEMQEKMRKSAAEHEAYMKKSQAEHEAFKARMKKSSEESAEILRKAEAMKKEANAVNDILKKGWMSDAVQDLNEMTGSGSKEDVEKMAEEGLANQAFNTLRIDQRTTLVAMMSTPFSSAFKALLSHAESLVSKELTTNSVATLAPLAEKINAGYKICINLSEEAKRTNDADIRELLTSIINNDIKISSLADSYFKDTTAFMKSTVTFLNQKSMPFFEQMKEMDNDEGKVLLEQARVVNLAALNATNICSRVFQTATVLGKVLGKFAA